MIVLPSLSQVTYTIVDKKYVCYTPDENRDIAYLIYYGSVNQELVNELSAELEQYKDLVLLYKGDSISCRLISNQINSKNVLLLEQQKKLEDELVIKKHKIKNKNWIIGGLSVTNVITAIILILSFK